MPLLALPVELLESILVLLDWQDILSFICTTKHITNNVLSKSSFVLLRRSCHAHLLAWETDEREKRGWPLKQEVKNSPWYEPDVTHPFYEGAQFPCYTCLEIQPGCMFTTGMKTGRHALGQKHVRERKCIPCGFKTGFYARGSGLPVVTCAVCIRCEHLMCMCTGWWQDPKDLEIIEPNLAGREIDTKLLLADPRTMSWMPSWWWDYSRQCLECVLAEKWTAEDFFAKKIRLREKQAWSQKVHRRYTQSMLDSRQRRWEQGYRKRQELGINHPAETPAIDLLRLKKNPFPKYRLE